MPAQLGESNYTQLRAVYIPELVDQGLDIDNDFNRMLLLWI